MKISGKYVNDHNWRNITKTTTTENAVTKITAKNEDADPAPCDGCGQKTLTLYPKRTGTISGAPLDRHDYLCKRCVQST